MMMMIWTAPKGMLSKEVVYLSKPRPERMSGPKVLVTAAPTFRSRDMPTQM